MRKTGEWHSPSHEEEQKFAAVMPIWGAPEWTPILPVKPGASKAFGHALWLAPQFPEEALDIIKKFQIEPYWDGKRHRVLFRMRRGALREFADITSKERLWKLLSEVLGLDTPEQVSALRIQLKQTST